MPWQNVARRNICDNNNNVQLNSWQAKLRRWRLLKNKFLFVYKIVLNCNNYSSSFLKISLRWNEFHTPSWSDAENIQDICSDWSLLWKRVWQLIYSLVERWRIHVSRYRHIDGCDRNLLRHFELSCGRQLDLESTRENKCQSISTRTPKHEIVLHTHKNMWQSLKKKHEVWLIYLINLCEHTKLNIGKSRKTLVVN